MTGALISAVFAFAAAGVLVAVGWFCARRYDRQHITRDAQRGIRSIDEFRRNLDL
jgi:hypothetical protein